MQHCLRKLFFLGLFLFVSGHGWALNNPPVNDSVCNAIDLGTMPAPGLCPNSPLGSVITFSGTTDFATFNPLDFSVTHCFASPSPDVWYKLRATGSYLEVNVVGSGGLNSFFVKLHHSQGSCLSLVPLDCIISTGNTFSFSFPTPVANGEYYLQIGGSNATQTGNFLVTMKSFNDCNGCVKQGNVQLDPAPTFGRYNTNDTVRMCATVNRWESLSTSYLHGIVPEFGPDWDTLSLFPTIIPASASLPLGWHWFNSIPTPNGTHSGFFFDGDGDGDPTNNAGDNGNILTSWTGCWKIKTINTCITNDLTVDVHLYSDAETGTSTNANFVCGQYDAIHISTAMSCCPAPNIVINQAVGCASGTASVVVGGSATSDTYNYSLVDTSMTPIQTYSNVVGSVTFSGLMSGQYYVIAEDLTIGCSGFQTITINPGIVLNMQQNLVGCNSGQGSAGVTVVNGGNYLYNYNWVGVPSVNTNDSIAFNLPDGWVHVIVTDTILGCSVEDSINIFSQGNPDATFDLPDNSFCSNTDSILVSSSPVSPGGYFNLLSPTSAGITVNPNCGTIFLNNTTFAPPYYIYVKYTVGLNCQSSYVDSVLIVAPPIPPVATSPVNSIYCIGSPSPVLSVSVGGNAIATWYDVQTSGTGFGNTYSTPLNGSTPAGTYFYLSNAVLTSNFNCISAATVFSVNATPSPVIASSNDTTICQGGTANVSINGCSTCSFVWSPVPTSGSQFASSFTTSPSSTTSYTVTATDLSGCSAIEFCDITVDASASCFLNFYHGITPNGDGHNDTWIVDGIDSTMNAYVSIYNRWGDKIWDGSNYDNTNVVWKGQDRNGNPLPDGTYFFLIQLSDSSLNGWIELSH